MAGDGACAPAATRARIPRQPVAGFVRAEYPKQTADMNIAAFAEGHLQNYSVVAEIFANMEEARRLALGAWQQIFTLGRAPLATLQGVSGQIEQAQRAA